MTDVQNINLSKIIKRLELIKSLISLEEEDEICRRYSNGSLVLLLRKDCILLVELKYEFPEELKRQTGLLKIER